MTYMFIEYDRKRKAFFTHEGIEPLVTLKKDDRYTYYLHASRRFIVKLVDGWVKPCSKIGELVGLDGNIVDDIDHPGRKHGEFSIGGLVAGDDEHFRFIVVPQGNNPQYFLRYKFREKTFEEAGVTVR